MKKGAIPAHENIVLNLTSRFAIDVDNVKILLHLSDKYDIESLQQEINIRAQIP